MVWQGRGMNWDDLGKYDNCGSVGGLIGGWVNGALG